MAKNSKLGQAYASAVTQILEMSEEESENMGKKGGSLLAKLGELKVKLPKKTTKSKQSAG